MHRNCARRGVSISQSTVIRIIGLLEAVLLVELVHAAAGVDELLLAGVEGVALGADFNGDVLLGRTGLNHIAAGAANGGLLIVGMNSLFHNCFSSLLAALIVRRCRIVTRRKCGFFFRLQLLLGVDLDAGAHGGGRHAGTDVLALCRSGFGLDDGTDEGCIVLIQLVGTEADLADGAVDDVRLVQTILNLTGFRLSDGLLDVGGNGAGLRGGHQALRSEELTETANRAHHIGAGNNGVKFKPVLFLDLLNEFHAAGIIGAGFLGLVHALGLAENKNADALARAVRQNDGTADLLVSVTAVDTELHMQLDGFVELRLAGGDDEIKCFLRLIQSLFINELCALFIIFTSEHFVFPPNKWLVTDERSSHAETAYPFNEE